MSNKPSRASGEDDFLKIAEAAAVLRVSYSTLYRWERDGRIEVQRTPTGQRRYRRSVIDAALTSAEAS